MNRIADHGRSEMSDMKRFCDIDGGIIQYDRLSFSFLRRSEPLLLSESFRYQIHNLLCPDIYIDIGTYGLGLFKSILFLQCLRDLLGNQNRRLSQLLG